jgi:hypothetical protein
VDVLDGDGDLVYPLATQLADVPRARAELAPSTSARLAPALFAESFALWTDLEAYESEQAAAEDPRFAAESLIPTGLFAPEEPRRRFLRRRSARPPEAQVLMTGVVEAVELRRNALAGRPFVWLAVRTFGATYEVVASADAEHPARGNVIQGGYWVVSTLPD